MQLREGTRVCEVFLHNKHLGIAQALFPAKFLCRACGSPHCCTTSTVVAVAKARSIAGPTHLPVVETHLGHLEEINNIYAVCCTVLCMFEVGEKSIPPQPNTAKTNKNGSPDWTCYSAESRRAGHRGTFLWTDVTKHHWKSLHGLLEIKQSLVMPCPVCWPMLGTLYCSSFRLLWRSSRRHNSGGADMLSARTECLTVLDFR